MTNMKYSISQQNHDDINDNDEDDINENDDDDDDKTKSEKGELSGESRSENKTTNMVTNIPLEISINSFLISIPVVKSINPTTTNSTTVTSASTTTTSTEVQNKGFTTERKVLRRSRTNSLHSSSSSSSSHIQQQQQKITHGHTTTPKLEYISINQVNPLYLSKYPFTKLTNMESKRNINDKTSLCDDISDSNSLTSKYDTSSFNFIPSYLLNSAIYERVPLREWEEILNLVRYGLSFSDSKMYNDVVQKYGSSKNSGDLSPSSSSSTLQYSIHKKNVDISLSIPFFDLENVYKIEYNVHVLKKSPALINCLLRRIIKKNNYTGDQQQVMTEQQHQQKGQTDKNSENEEYKNDHSHSNSSSDDVVKSNERDHDTTLNLCRPKNPLCYVMVFDFTNSMHNKNSSTYDYMKLISDWIVYDSVPDIFKERLSSFSDNGNGNENENGSSAYFDVIKKFLNDWFLEHNKTFVCIIVHTPQTIIIDQIESLITNKRDNENTTHSNSYNNEIDTFDNIMLTPRSDKSENTNKTSTKATTDNTFIDKSMETIDLEKKKKITEGHHRFEKEDSKILKLQREKFEQEIRNLMAAARLIFGNHFIFMNIDCDNPIQIATAFQKINTIIVKQTVNGNKNTPQTSSDLTFPFRKNKKFKGSFLKPTKNNNSSSLLHEEESQEKLLRIFNVVLGL